MLKRKSFYVVALFSVALFMTAGCATQDVVKKDEGLVPAQVAKQADQSKSTVTSPKQAASTPGPLVKTAQTPAPDQQAQKASSASQLQSSLEKIYFDFDSANLSDSARKTLSKNAAALMKETSAKIGIEGNCDERGSAEYNLALGERRAKAAQQYLVALGVKPDRLVTISYGKEKPAVQGDNEAAWAKNRRDEFVVITK
jgi:peptidoglycan-associated lipoprotein